MTHVFNTQKKEAEMSNYHSVESASNQLLADFVAATELARELGVTPSTLARYENQPESLFPLGVKVGRRRLYSRRAIVAWLRMRVGEPIDDAA